ncbi:MULTISPECIES: cytochrome d ubiquinol oxidase subunit II [Pedobacter]|uniref:Cytochrome bd ubiquinol oxidase subunit II n=1 Tax=Pedobacter heparinus (strain ATCC 13125 / DSM 2366 / CIP 104194 / JCM 7457 / NBRC 12017 / NCIMB 9290 / NRRL B-14731 / HIM 762-3) TaxID=485917 RepID=C6XT47_PEDHD|nr:MULTISPECIES: cytochrome d ubiquinol oxidase subunit II [Pedobacter]ACU03608.1 cytochrome bd ubiquinol oxidase subunit II [Pedobacter heparinus DSM 2366]MBB5436880.1 cytochrome d ubiquinol oxidase subunit II [Pedobacter sp. AK017]
MIYVVIVFLWTAILLYILLGGADFGAGIIELMTAKTNKAKTRKTMYKAIGPIWEANHMWLIIAIVILFVGFPKIYTTISVYLHIPLVCMLLGIIARGTAFVFRNYDAVKDDMQKIYTPIFVYSSLITPFFLGIIAASSVSGQIDPSANNFLSAYIFSWLNWFSVAVGIFTVSICGFLATIFIIGQTDNDGDREHFVGKARRTIFIVMFCGALVFIAAYSEGIPLASWIFGDTPGLIAIIAASISLLVMFYALKKDKPILLRLLAGFQVTMILFAATYTHFPDIVLLKNGENLSLLTHQGQARTIASLGYALLIGSIFILPALVYLIYIFQKRQEVPASH